MSPTALFELIDPPSHWSPFSLVHPFSANPNGPPSHWSPISLVPQCNPGYTVLIGPPFLIGRRTSKLASSLQFI